MNRRALLGLKDTTRKTGGGGGAPPPRPRKMSQPPNTGTVRRSRGGPGGITVETGLDTPDAALRTRVAQSAPRLRAAYAGVVQQAANGLLPGAPPDLERLIAQLQAATDRTLGRAGARLLIGTVMVV